MGFGLWALGSGLWALGALGFGKWLPEPEAQSLKPYSILTIKLTGTFAGR
jgi:hypothetical protein